MSLGEAQMQKEIEAGRWRGQDKASSDRDGGAAAGPAAKPVPKPYLSAQYREDSMRTTGGALPLGQQIARTPFPIMVGCSWQRGGAAKQRIAGVCMVQNLCRSPFSPAPLPAFRASLLAVLPLLHRNKL